MTALLVYCSVGVSRRVLLAGVLALTTVSALAAETNAPGLLPPKPKWLTEASLTVRESYDNNVFLAGASGRYLPPVYTIPADGVAALKNQYSWITTVSPKIGLELAPLLGNNGVLRSLTLGYAADFVTFHDAPSENYDVHRLAAGVRLASDDLTFQADNLCTYMDGGRIAASYPGVGLYSAFVSDQATRDRRAQALDRASASLQYDQPAWFVRGVGALVNCNYLTHQYPSAIYSGYMNYVDRYDVNVGGDFGYKLATNLAITASCRIGRQHQDLLPVGIDPYQQSSSCEYQRFLLGVEGLPCDWLTVRIQAGPDFRDYAASAPVRHDKPVTFYEESSLEVRVTPDNILSFTSWQCRWVASSGKIPYDGRSFALNYLRKVTDALSLKAGVRAIRYAYHCALSYSAGLSTPATAPANGRDDWDLIESVGATYAVTSRFSIDLNYAASFGRNADGTALADTRNFNDQIVSLGATLRF